MNRSAVAQDATTEPRPHRLTREDFHRMGEAGIFAPDARVELIEGEIIDMPPPGQKHKSKVNRLTHLLVRAVGERAIVSVQNPAILGTWSEPQPDLALFVATDDFYEDVEQGVEDVLLVVEVSHTTLRYDRDVKMPLYAGYGIPEAWLIDVKRATLTRHRAPEAGRYSDVEILGSLRGVPVPGVDGVTVDLSSLFASKA